MASSILAASAATSHALHLPHLPAGPLVAAAALVSMPLWRDRLADYSQLAADMAPILGLAIGLATLWHAIRGGNASDADKARRSAIGSAVEAFGAAAKRGGPIAAAAVALVAVFSIFAGAIAGGKEQRMLAVASAAPLPAARRRKSTDDAGEDGTDASDIDASGTPKWFAEGLALRGQHEGTSRKPNPKVQALFADAGFPGIKDTTKTAWCAAFVGACLKRAGHASGNTLAARKFLEYGTGLDKPKPGCIVVLWRGSPKGWQGHVGFYVREDATHVWILGGNQSDNVTVAAFPKSRVLGYRWPRRLIDTATVKGAAVAAGGAAVSAGSQIADKLAPVQETVDALKPLQAPLTETGLPWAIQLSAWIGVTMAAVAVAGALIAIWGRKRALKATG